MSHMIPRIRFVATPTFASRTPQSRSRDPPSASKLFPSPKLFPSGRPDLQALCAASSMTLSICSFIFEPISLSGFSTFKALFCAGSKTAHPTCSLTSSSRLAGESGLVEAVNCSSRPSARWRSLEYLKVTAAQQKWTLILDHIKRQKCKRLTWQQVCNLPHLRL